MSLGWLNVNPVWNYAAFGRAYIQLLSDRRLHDYETLDASIVQTVIPEGMPQRRSTVV